MQLAVSINPFDISDMVEEFMHANNSDLHYLCGKHYGENELAFESFKTTITPILQDACINFVNNNYPALQLKPYLIAVIINFLKAEKEKSVKLQTQFICPGCRYHKQDTILFYNRLFKCDVCSTKLKSVSGAKEINFFTIFANHNKKGFRCDNCARFIPQPLNNGTTIICPYYDCCFVGTSVNMKEMRHPFVQSKVNINSLDSNISPKDNIISNVIPVDKKIELEEDFVSKLETLKDITQSQINSLYYSGTDSTLMHKVCMYQAFMNLINKYPGDMISYLVLSTHNGGMQHKLFQEYVRILESKIPFTFSKNKKMYRVNSLLDNNLNVFDGVSIFDSVVSEKKSIKNLTNEFYIGGRKGSYSQPYYIGKLLDVVDIEKGKSILSDVKEYSFSKIKLNQSLMNTKVKVSHLRIPPHYQMGSMAYLNRIRKKIVDKVALTLNENKLKY